jgi:hypothetical protein
MIYETLISQDPTDVDAEGTPAEGTPAEGTPAEATPGVEPETNDDEL